MLRIPCPYCGSTRDEDEFTFGGALVRVRPVDPHNLSDVAWASYMFDRENARGPSAERWRHTFGCRQWFRIERDTVSHALLRVAELDHLARQSNVDSSIKGELHEAG